MISKMIACRVLQMRSRLRFRHHPLVLDVPRRCFVATFRVDDNSDTQNQPLTAFHKSGKHCIEYRRSGEKRWLYMQRTAFYIVERAPPSAERGEVKEMEPDPTEGLAPIEKWSFQEDITPEFCVALSQLHRSYGCKIQETGHKTVGHTCVTDRDKAAARQVKGSLLYGELLPRGVNKAMGAKHLNAAKARTVFDLGMGTGKVAMQVFLQFPNLTRVYGIELSQARYTLGEAALLALMEMQPGVYGIKRHLPGQFISIETLPQPSLEEVSASLVEDDENRENTNGGEGDERGEDTGTRARSSSGSAGGAGVGAGVGRVRAGSGSSGGIGHSVPGRTLEFACGNLFDVTDIVQADLVLLETDVSSEVYPQLSRFLSGMRKGSQALTYLDLRKMWGSLPFPYRQVDVNRPLSDRFPTSWSVNRGHHFFLWSKILPPLEQSPLPGEEQASVGSHTDQRRDRFIHRKLSGSSAGGSCHRGFGVTSSGDLAERDGLRAASKLSAVAGAGSGARGGGADGSGANKPGRRGHSKFPRLPFFACLGFGRKNPLLQGKHGLPSGEEATTPTAPVAAATAPRSGSATGRHPSIQELFLLESISGKGNRNGAREVWEDDDVDMEGGGGGKPETGAGGLCSPVVPPRSQASRGRLSLPSATATAPLAPKCSPPPPATTPDLVQQGPSRGQELTEAAELGAMRSPPAGGSDSGSCAAM